MTDPLRSLVMKHANSNELKAEAQRGGMLTMYEDGMRKALRGDTTFEEVLRVTREAEMRTRSRVRPGEAMAVYRYRAVNPAGEVAVGELDAANEAEIVDRLRDQGMMPMQIDYADRRRTPARRRGGRARAGAAARMVPVEEGHARPAARRSRASWRRCCMPG